MNNCDNSGNFTDFSQNFAVFSAFSTNLDIIEHICEIPDFFSSKFRREIAILMQNLRMFEWIIIHFYSIWPKLWRVSCWTFEFWAVQKYVNFVGTFGIFFFSSRGLPDRPHRNHPPKIPFPYWKIHYFIYQMGSISLLANDSTKFNKNRPAMAREITQGTQVVHK